MKASSAELRSLAGKTGFLFRGRVRRGHGKPPYEGTQLLDRSVNSYNFIVGARATGP